MSPKKSALGTPDPVRRQLLIAGTASVCLAPSLAQAIPAPGKGAVRLVATEFPPYTSAALPFGGTAGAVTRAAMARAGMSMVLQFRPWARALAELQNGQWDGIVGAWHSAEREAYLSFARPLGITPCRRFCGLL